MHAFAPFIAGLLRSTWLLVDAPLLPRVSLWHPFFIALVVSNGSRLDHVTLVVEHLLENVAGVVPYPTYYAALIVYVLILDRQITDVTYEVLPDHPSILVEGGFEDVSGIVYGALHNLARPGALSSLLSLVSCLSCCATSLIGYLSGLFCGLIRNVGCPLSRLAGSVLYPLHGLARLFGSLPSSIARTLGNFARRIPDSLGRLVHALSRL